MRDLFSFSNVYRCYLRCRKKKRNTANALRFETHLEDGICNLEDELKTKTYQPTRSVCFVAKKPKLREIFAADFNDRIVHHILVDHIERIFEPKFIFDSWSCRVKKGNLTAVRRLQKFTRQVTSNSVRQAFYLQMDIKSFFVNIDKNRLFEIIKRKYPVPPAADHPFYKKGKMEAESVSRKAASVSRKAESVSRKAGSVKREGEKNETS